ncbi:hypothetical protein [uncultured Psychrobacter sp.]|uniref:hypothetical protein n=1 Tax=uncultured Psychrobacter sp. TaxID=259303 RepID=UPI0025959180|nr:hypothetical protein [uncultured Psychrobacter sp.]
MTQIKQISDIRKSAYLIIGALGTTAGKAKSLEREHYSFGELEAIHSAMLNAAARFRGGVFFQRPSADSAIANRFDRCAIEASAGVTAQQSQLAQIDSVIADAKAIIEMFKQLTLDIEQLKADHPKTPDIDALYRAATDALKEYRRINAPLRAIRKDAAITNGITAADGRAGIGEIIARFDSATTTNHKPQAKIGAKHEK